MVNDALCEVSARRSRVGAVTDELARDVVSHVELSSRTAVGDRLALGKSRFEATVDEAGCLIPSYVLEHQRSGEQDGARVGHVFAGVLGRLPVVPLEQGCLIADIGSGGEPNTAGHGGRGV